MNFRHEIRFQLSALLLMTCLLLSTGYAQRMAVPASDQSGAQDALDDRYIVVFHSYGPEASAAVRSLGGRVALELPRRSALAAHLPAPAAHALAANPNVQSVERDVRRYPMSQTTPYGISMVQANQVSDSQASGRKVCVIDSGYYVGHEDLPNSNVTGDSDPFGAGNWFEDGFGHGTHVSGILVALNNALGVQGVLPNGNLPLHMVRVFNNEGTWAYSSTLVDALDKCRAAGANVVNMSLGGPNANFFEEAAFDEADAAGVLSVAAAGNGASTAYSYPASYSSVISVAAIDSNKVVAGFSQQNNQVELAAPGVGVLSTVPYLENNTLTVNGTTWQGNWMQNAARSSGASGTLASGGRCTSTNATWSGKVVMCERGDISFFDKVRNVQNSGGVAAVIYNNVSGNFLGTLGPGNSSTIPAISLSQEDGQSIVASQMGLPGTVVSLVTKPASGYESWDGTSMATPHVAGVAALVWSHYPTCTNVEIRQALRTTAQDLGPAGKDNAYGYGLVQAKA
ncbi:MAG: S8 family serine peptidase, partial [Terriglobales bacterium]